MNFATFKTLDPTIGRWLQVDPLAEHDMASTPYNSMYNNPISYNDPNGDCPNCVLGGIGAVIGGYILFRVSSGYLEFYEE